MTAGEPLQEVTSLYQPWTPHDSLLCPPACLTHPGLSWGGCRNMCHSQGDYKAQPHSVMACWWNPILSPPLPTQPCAPHTFTHSRSHTGYSPLLPQEQSFHEVWLWGRTCGPFSASPTLFYVISEVRCRMIAGNNSSSSQWNSLRRLFHQSETRSLRFLSLTLNFNELFNQKEFVSDPAGPKKHLNLKCACHILQPIQEPELMWWKRGMSLQESKLSFSMWMMEIRESGTGRCIRSSVFFLGVLKLLWRPVPEQPGNALANGTKSLIPFSWSVLSYLFMSAVMKTWWECH